MKSEGKEKGKVRRKSVEKKTENNKAGYPA